MKDVYLAFIRGIVVDLEDCLKFYLDKHLDGEKTDLNDKIRQYVKMNELDEDDRRDALDMYYENKYEMYNLVERIIEKEYGVYFTTWYGESHLSFEKVVIGERLYPSMYYGDYIIQNSVVTTESIDSSANDEENLEKLARIFPGIQLSQLQTVFVCY